MLAEPSDMPTSTEDPAQLLALGVAERQEAQRKLQTTLGTMLEKLAKENDRQAEGQWDLHGNLENLIAMLLEQNDRNAVIEKGLRKAMKKADRLEAEVKRLQKNTPQSKRIVLKVPLPEEYFAEAEAEQ